MIRAVLDTNVLVSAAVAQPGTTLAAVLDAVVANRFQLILSEPILRELRRTLARPYYAARVPPATAAAYVRSLVVVATTVRITTSVRGVATHPEDDPILATALSAGADFLVTGDRRLRERVRDIEGIPLLAPADFLAELSRQEAERGC